ALGRRALPPRARGRAPARPRPQAPVAFGEPPPRPLGRARPLGRRGQEDRRHEPRDGRERLRGRGDDPEVSPTALPRRLLLPRQGAASRPPARMARGPDRGDAGRRRVRRGPRGALARWRPRRADDRPPRPPALALGGRLAAPDAPPDRPPLAVARAARL